MKKDKYSYNTPFAGRYRAKNIDGIYRDKNSGKLMMLRNMYFQGVIDGETEMPYDAYQGEITLEGCAPVKKCLISHFDFYQNYERVF